MSDSGSPFSMVQHQFREAKTLCLHVSKPTTKEKQKSYTQVAPSVKQPVVKQVAGELKLNNSRPSFIGIRLSQEEREYVVKQAEKSRLTISEYVRASVLGAGYISTIDPLKRQLLKDLSRELGRQGNNLNQIAKHINAGASKAEGNSMLGIIARSLLSVHMKVAQALAEGRRYE